MPMLQVRHVPDGVHRTLKARAAKAGKSLSEYVLEELVRLAERPTLAELYERMQARDVAYPPPDLDVVTDLNDAHAERERHLGELTPGSRADG